MVQAELEMLKIQENEEKNSKDDNILITQAEVGASLQKKATFNQSEPPKNEKSIFRFEEIVDRVQKNEDNKPKKPIFNVFQCSEQLEEKLNVAINVVKQEKKWVVL
jgi:hypothetical protein